jgi:sodium-dependent phosphate cotransporter
MKKSSKPSKDGRSAPGWISRHTGLWRFAGALVLLYGFLLSIDMMGASFKLFGKGFAENLIATCANPVAGLFIGILSTSIIQSSSTTTSLAVGFVGGGVLPLRLAIPIIMGANVGTTITNILVSFGFVTRKEDFRRAFAGATVHDFFNICSVLVFFPIEIRFHLIERLARRLTTVFDTVGGAKFSSPLKTIIKPAVSGIQHVLSDDLSLSEPVSGGLMLALAIVMLAVSLVLLVRLLRQVIVNHAEGFVNRYLFRNDVTAMLLGLCLTVLAQSSSVTTSLIIPLVGAGVVSLHRCFPFTLGANVGTTCTALLAALATVQAGAGGSVGVTTAFAHLLFNLLGMLIFYPLRRIPITLAESLAGLATESKKLAILFVLATFFGLPFLLLSLARCF